MFTKHKLPLAVLLAGTVLALSGTAFAGSCPAGQKVADGQGQKPGATAPKDVTDVVLGSIDLGDPAGRYRRTGSSGCAVSRSSPVASCHGTATTTARR